MKPNSRRIAAVVGALAVTGVTAIGAIAGTATAAGTGTCTSNVNVRSEPTETAPVVGVCERGETTSVGQSRDGFVELPEFGGWAVADYVSTSAGSSPQTGSSEDSLTPAGAESAATPSTSSSPSSTEDGEDGGTSSSPSSESPSSESPSSGASETPEPTSSPSDSFFSDDDD